MLWYQLLRPLAYLSIRDGSKWKIDILVPIFIALPTTIAILSLPVRPQIYMGNGLISQISSFLQIMPGFYLAALAAIATFNKSDMDAHMPQPTPNLRIQIRGVEHPIKLTRRRMLSLQFGYLTFLSLVLVIILIGANTIAPSMKMIVASYLEIWVNGICIGILSLGFWHMIIVTVFGLYQLSDRMHQPDQG